MNTPTFAELRRAAELVAPRHGWDFSRMRDETGPAPWDYVEVVRRYLKPTDRVLDLGTGGGERFLALAPGFSSGIGIDVSAEMILAANENTPGNLRDRIAFAVMRSEELDLPDSAFDVMLDRHAPFAPGEVARVLRSGGCFVTQQIGRNNMQNVFKAFGWASSGAYWDAERSRAGLPPHSIDEAARAFVEHGCEVVARGFYDVEYHVHDIESLLFWLQSVPLPEQFDVDRHLPLVHDLITRFAVPRGFATNEARDLLLVRKR